VRSLNIGTGRSDSLKWTGSAFDNRLDSDDYIKVTA
jgi:hypothetical protein